LSVGESECGLRGHRLEEAEIVAGIGFFGTFLAERDKAEEFIFDRKRQEQLGRESGQFLALMLRQIRVDPGAIVVEINAGGFGFFAEPFNGSSGIGEFSLGSRIVAEGVGRAIETVPGKKNSDTGNVEGFGNFCRDAFEKRFGFDDGTNFVTETGEDLFGVVGVAEETAIGPCAELCGDFPKREHDRKE
jgi:hypothetical protein